jgi:hypothetical protein
MMGSYPKAGTIMHIFATRSVELFRNYHGFPLLQDIRVSTKPLKVCVAGKDPPLGSNLTFPKGSHRNRGLVFGNPKDSSNIVTLLPGSRRQGGQATLAEEPSDLLGLDYPVFLRNLAAREAIRPVLVLGG